MPEADNNDERLYSRYDRIWKTIAKCPANNKGVYFRRLMAYLPEGMPAESKPVNQLKHVVETFRGGNHRHSALQASIFDPTRDHTHNRRRGFPCLQQVALDASDRELAATGFYALQHHVPKAYGNYLGLCWLGRFMAHQMGLRLSQVTCVASSLKLGDGCTKSGLVPLKERIDAILEQYRRKAA
jgi:thymidylate synthase